MHHCAPLYVFVTLIFVSNAIAYYVRHEASHRDMLKSKHVHPHHAEHITTTHHILQVKSVIFYLIACLFIYYTCVAEIYFNPAWLIITFYAIWVLFEVILAKFFLGFLDHRHSHTREEGVVHHETSVRAYPQHVVEHETHTPTEMPTEVPTEAPTEAPTETPTEVPTEVPTEAPTEAPTEVPTEAPTIAPTEAPISHHQQEGLAQEELEMEEPKYGYPQ